ncbi:hypothetical protein ACQEVZ_29960 [Dactylosporangium sp. CA-152071]|uniref:hypothetical protein n=1 Tax=Dactylosporangium sp. CA-152071 TaxID=3239933 RepID=UPI003D90FE2A
MAKTPHHENAVRSYPDDPHPGTTTNHGGAKHSTRTRRPKTAPIPMRIARVDAIPMTDEELDKAGKALGVLLNQFRRAHPELFT